MRLTPHSPRPRALVALAFAIPVSLGIAGCSSSDDATVVAPSAATSGTVSGTGVSDATAGGPAAAQSTGGRDTGEQAARDTATTLATPEPAAWQTLEYAGEDGKTALELLKRADPEASWTGSGKNAFVVEINGHAADSKHEFWALYINGEPAQVGAGSLVTKDGDTIEWKLEKVR